MVLQEEQVCDVKRTRQVIYTTRPWNEISFNHGLAEKGLSKTSVDEDAAKENRQLYCRWKYTQVHSKLQTGAKASISLLMESEAVGIGLLTASELRKNWYGKRSPSAGGTWKKYTLGDCFCGAGGISRGAGLAGLHVSWGFDSDEHAAKTHAHNFHKYGTKSLEMTDAEFLLSIGTKGYRADVVHYSPPCQPFSAANHNKNPERDFTNQKALFSIYH